MMLFCGKCRHYRLSQTNKGVCYYRSENNTDDIDDSNWALFCRCICWDTELINHSIKGILK